MSSLSKKESYKNRLLHEDSGAARSQENISSKIVRAKESLENQAPSNKRQYKPKIKSNLKMLLTQKISSFSQIKSKSAV